MKLAARGDLPGVFGFVFSFVSGLATHSQVAVRVRAKRRWIFSLILFAFFASLSPVLALAQSSIGYPTIQCSATNPPLNSGDTPSIPGRWWNLQRRGTGWDLIYQPADPNNPSSQLQLMVYWYAYDQLHRPIWLVSDMQPVNATTNQWAANLNLVSWSASNYGGLGGGAAVPVGKVAIQFFPGTATAAALRWQFNQVSGNAAPDECIYNYFASSTGTAAAAPTPSLPASTIDTSYSGLWYDPTHSTWGMSETVGVLPTSSGNQYVELNGLLIYDQGGAPTWLQAQSPTSTTPPPTGANSPYSLLYAKSTYSLTQACTTNCVTSTTVGSLTRTFSSSHLGTLTATASVSSAQTGGSYGVVWPNPSMPFKSSGTAVTNPSNITKLLGSEYLFVSQQYCQLPAGQTNCTIVVSWAYDDPTAGLYMHDYNSGQITSVALSSPTSASVTLPASSDVQFEVHSAAGTLLLTSAEVRVSPASPNTVTVPSAGNNLTTSISWTRPAVGPNPAYYVLQYQAYPGGVWQSTGGNITATSASVTLPAYGTYAFQVQACNSPTLCSSFTPGSNPLTVSVPAQNGSSPYTPMVPVRLLDTRSNGATVDNQFARGGAIPNGSKIDLTVTGRAGIPSSGVSAVALNVTVTNPGGAGYLTVWPAGAAQPLASNINFVAGATISNQVIAPVGTNGQVSIYVYSGGTSADVTADVAGYFLASSNLTPLNPARLLDTRAGMLTSDGLFAGKGAVPPQGITNVTVLGRGGLPAAGVTAVVLNVTAINPTGLSYITIWPAGAAQPNASNLNVVPGQTIANLVVAAPGNGGQISIYNNAGNTDFIVDIVGYFTNSATMVPLTPARLLDTRAGFTTIDGQFAGQGGINSASTLSFKVVGRGGVPSSGVGAVVLNVTAVTPTANGYLTAWGTTSNNSPPPTVAVTFATGQVIPSLVIAQVGYDGTVSLFNGSSGSTPVIADVVGWLPGSSGGTLPTLGAAFVSQSVPTSMTAGQTYSVSVTMQNIGSATWTEGQLFRLGSQSPQDGTTWGFGRVYLPSSASVPTGQTNTFTFSVTAPSTAGTYIFQWRMVQDGVAWFGDKSPDVAVTVNAVAQSAAFLGQNVPTTMVAGQSYPVSITMVNTGTATWTSAQNYRLGAQNPQDNTTWGNTMVVNTSNGPVTVGRVALPNSVAPGQQVAFSFNVTAPTVPGTYNFQWEMLQEAVAWFGDKSQNVAVTVSAASNTLPTSPSLPPTATSVNDAVTHDPTVGTMAGSASTDGGAAQYHVPIVVPPGRAGMQPDLALVYNSRSGNGVMGMGWTISGLSSIHRCPQTPEQDGRALGVSYTNSDRLCLDGQRLVLVSTGVSYGAANAVYRTEVDSYARITQVGGDLTGASTCFRVEQKNGRVLHYGAVTGTMSNGVLSTPSCATSTANSKLTPSGAPAPLSWLVEKIEDHVGNNQLYQYDKSFGNGEVLLSSVTYTGFQAGSGDRSVKFAYEGRTAAATNATDVSSSYLAGYLTMQTQALKSITTSVGSTTVRTYTPAYIASTYNGRLMMTSITECAGSTCHSPTQFTYSDSALNFSLNAMTNVSSALPTGLQAWSYSSIGDLDGDGTPEYMVLGSNSSGSQTSSFLAKVAANGQITTVDMTGTPFYRDLALYKMARGDIDGSGRTDFSILPAYTINSDGSTTSNPGNLQLGFWAGATGASLSAGSTPQATFNTTFHTFTTNVPVDSSSQVFFQDMNGDGKLDIVVTASVAGCSGRGVFVYLNNLTTTLANATTSTGFIAPAGSLFCLTSVHNSGATFDFTNQAIDHIADFDGDGLPDIFVTDSNLQSGASNFVGVYRVALSGTGTSATVSASLTACASTGLTGTIDCKLAVSSGNGAVSGVAQWVDINGDGLEDLVMAKPSAMGGTDQWIVRLNQGGGTYANPIIAQNPTGDLIGLTDKTYNGSYRYLNKLQPVDVDGDGKPDIVYPSASGFALKMCTVVIVGPLASGECPSVNSSKAVVNPPISLAGTVQCLALACPEDPGTPTTGSPVINLPSNSNAPGYPYAWDNQAAAGLYTSNKFQGGPADHSAYHLDMLKFVQTNSTTINVQRVPTSLVSGVNNTRDSSVSNDMGGTGLETIPALLGCSGKPLVINNMGTSTYYAACDVVEDADSVYGPPSLPDVNGTPTNNFQPSPKSASTASGISSTVSLYANFNQGASLPGQAPRTSLPSDLNGGCSSYAPLPGLMYSAANGLGDAAFWDFDTLAEAFLCTRDGVAEYNVDGTYGDSRHYYFSSSMPVVSTMLQSNGIGSYTGARSAIYSYGDAMYNHYGRGFQGFRTITTENASSDAKRRLITTTTFNQKFPLVGKVASVVTGVAPSNSSGASPVVSLSYSCTLADGTAGTCTAKNPVQIETTSYQCTLLTGTTLSSLSLCPQGDGLLPLPSGATSTGGTVFQPVAVAQAANSYDLKTSALSGHSSTGLTWDSYGNLQTQTVTRGDDASGGKFVSGHVTTSTNTYDYTKVSDWWIDRLSTSSVTVSMSYVAGTTTTPPTGTDISSKTLATQFTWNADRTPATKIVQSGVANQQSTTTYSYPVSPATSYGLPIQVQVDAWNLATALSPTRITSYTYTKGGTSAEADGYFVYTKTLDPTGLNQTLTYTVQPSDGQVKQVKDPNSVSVLTTYDVFGRATQIRHVNSTNADIESPVQIAYTNCSNGSCVFTCPGSCTGTVGEDYTETYAAYRVTTTQVGYPTKVNWLDMLGHSVKQAEAGFSGTSGGALQYSFIASVIDYDEHGAVQLQSTPYQIGSGNPSYTSFTYDALNRPTNKTAPLACAGTDPATSPYGAMSTTYTYVGRQTNISTSGTCTDSTLSRTTIQMSRSVNVLGQLMQTKDANTKTTSYWTEPLGHVAAITDADSKSTLAVYNALGQRTQSNDPDQGIWNFTYDALGELLTQTDARNVKTTVTARDALGRELSRQAVPPAGAPASVDDEAIVDTTTYDPVTPYSCIGRIGTQTRYRGPNLTTPSTNPMVWQQSITCDASARPSSITTTINEGTQFSFTHQQTYDGAGRLATQVYPTATGTTGGLTVQHRYTAYGQLDALSNAGTSYVYWTAQAQNEWGHITKETYPGLIYGTHGDYDSTGQTQKLSWTNSASDEADYWYDGFGNVAKQTRASGGGASVSESYAYDNLQRLTGTSRVPSDANHLPVTYSYSDSGNVKSKSDWASSYTYGTGFSTGSCGPHFATQAGSYTYQCDANGNLVGGNTLSGVYDAENRAAQITRTAVGAMTQSGTMSWRYGADGAMAMETDQGSSITGTRYFGPAGYEQVGSGAAATQKYELGPVVVTRTNNGLGSSSDALTVVLRDRLGSTIDVIENGGMPTTRAYDAFGRARNGDFGDRANGTLNLVDNILGGLQTIHGFTKHDHADDVALIHMGGRVYDQNLGRFLQVDPVIGGTGSQALNPYSYIGNNPLSGTDPTGYQCVGSHIESQTCADTGASSTQVATPSVTEKNDAIAKGLANGFQNAFVKDFNGKQGNGADSMTTNGAQSTPNNNQAASVGAQGQTVGQRSSIGAMWDAFKNTLQRSVSDFTDDYYYDGFSPVRPNDPTKSERLDAQHAQLAANNPVATEIGSFAGVAATMVAFPEGGAEAKAASWTNAGAQFGNATSNAYRATFFAAYPELEGQVVVHHAVEQQVLSRFPGVVSKSEIHSLENLRGIPLQLNSELHLSTIRTEWNRFYKLFEANGTSPTKPQLLQKATEIDQKYGTQFNPPR